MFAGSVTWLQNSGIGGMLPLLNAVCQKYRSAMLTQPKTPLGVECMLLISGQLLENGAAAVALVLCTGVDPMVMMTQRLMLEQVGHQVVSVSAEKELEKACATHPFDVAVIGHGMSSQAKPRVLTLVRKHCPAAAILELYAQYTDRSLPEADAWLPMPVGPEEFIDVVNSLANKRTAG